MKNQHINYQVDYVLPMFVCLLSIHLFVCVLLTTSHKNYILDFHEIFYL